jgi:hypothetical protein
MGPAGQQASDTAVSGNIARPPVLYLACLLGLVLDRGHPLSKHSRTSGVSRSSVVPRPGSGG